MTLKKIIPCLIIMILTLTGAGISVYLSAHFYTETSGGLMFCEGDACESVIQSEYASVLGIPLSSYAVLFYSLIFLALLITVYIGGQYYMYAWALIFPLSVIALIIDLILAGILVKLGKVCPFCVATYMINILIFTTLLYALKILKKEFSVTLKDIFLSTFRIDPKEHERRAVAGLFALISVMLVVILFLSSINLKHSYKTEAGNPLSLFYESEPVDVTFPKSSMTLGRPDAQIKIMVFTDFFCNACYELFLTEAYLMTKYKNKLWVVYYNYPHSGSCEPKDGKLPRSCIAAKAFLASGEIRIFPAYLAAHYSDYKNLHKSYNESEAIRLASKISKDEEAFAQQMNSPEIAERLERDIKLSHKLDITVTPTIFINGRKIPGTPRRDLFEAIIKKELSMN